jgi:hypothetical protein
MMPCGNRVTRSESDREVGRKYIHESGCATTWPPSGVTVTITPWPIRTPLRFPFYAWFIQIVELTITIRWTILDPMTSHTQGKSDTPSVVRRKYRTYVSAHNGSTHHITTVLGGSGRSVCWWCGVKGLPPRPPEPVPRVIGVNPDLTGREKAGGGREKEKEPAIV